ncbi:uncharacterized protein LOC126696547 [Quercus robur]|uniref:uncharacterized protein LOC126696547 n=1 Tax=Quercus robur TaxID=38942 RepID=UPI00216225CA|nr:uncharacterized protein LOC126696547 [Quercus robur]
MADPSSPPIRDSISQEEFNMFHTIDRTLFTRLVFNLGRDPAEATQVMALWLWLEKVGEEIDMVYSKILSLPDTILNALVDESVMALTCIESDQFRFSSDSTSDMIPLIQSLTKTGVSLRFFHDNRIGIIRGVTKIINEVCVRAFDDIVKLAQANKSAQESTGIGFEFAKPGNYHSAILNPLSSALYYNSSGVVGVQSPNVGVSQFLDLAPHVPVSGGGLPLEVSRGFDPYDLSFQRQILNNEIGEVLSRIKSSSPSDEEAKEVPPDERTIFLTFSKGYPITENEVREFFTRKFGDFIEDIFMQEVLPEEQPLYARLVVPVASFIEVVLDHKNKAKFSINGKHVWARKYVRKNKSPAKSSPSASQPTSPAAAEQS